MVMLEKTLENPLDCKENTSANSKGNQPWIFIEKTEAEVPILWPPWEELTHWKRVNSHDAEKDWGQKEKGVTEDEMAEWHHWLNEHESEQTPGDSEEQESLEYCSPWGRKESEMT